MDKRRRLQLKRLTGLRRGARLGLCWQDVDLAAGVLHVQQILEQIDNPQDTGPKTMLVFPFPIQSF